MAKPKIEHVHVDVGSSGVTVHWTIGDRKFHVWLSEAGDGLVPEDIVHSNPVTRDPNARRDEYRKLDRASKAQAVIWELVSARVRCNDMIAKAWQERADKLAVIGRRNQLRQRMREIEQEALAAWKRESFAASAIASSMLDDYRYREAELAALAPTVNEEV